MNKIIEYIIQKTSIFNKHRKLRMREHRDMKK